MVDFTKLGAQAVAAGVDMTKAQTGGAYPIPAAGFVKLRFISYVELGKHEETFKGETKIKDRVMLTFELSGPKHPPIVTDSGEQVPHRISIEETVSRNDKANFFKLFTRMNYAGKARHMIQLLGSPYIGTVVHRKYAKAGEDKAKPETWTGVAVELRRPDTGYTIMPPRYDDPATGDTVVVEVPPAITKLKGFLWDFPDMEQWGDIFIDGDYPARVDGAGKVTSPAKSKNVFQNRIKAAKNFHGSPIQLLLEGGGAPLDLPAPEPGYRPHPTEGDDDVLAGIVF